MVGHAESSSRYLALEELAFDLRWSWNHASDILWQELDAKTWEATRNPLAILRSASRARLEEQLATARIANRLDTLIDEKQRVDQAPTWFDRTYGGTAPLTIAYFSMEFMLTEALPIYSGGLGNVAGDQLKVASDLGVPVVGIGLLYAQGYFRQAIGPDGSQEALYPVNEPGQLPIRPVRTQDGEWLRLQIELPGTTLWIRTWEVQVGKRRLYLLDMNDPANPPIFRCITSELYGGGPETRLRQEMVLGLAGWQLLRTLGINPEVCHLNEGHAAFAALERARCFQVENNVPFAEALAITRVGNIFTTHTAVKAGFDRFSAELMNRHFKFYAEKHLDISIDEFLALGRQNADDQAEPFNMAYLAVRTSGAVNGVSALHAEVSRHLFQPLFPRWPTPEIPIGHVTNGIHVPTWDSIGADELWTDCCGKERWRGDLSGLTERIRAIDDGRIWQLRCGSRRALTEEIRRQYRRQRIEDGEIAETEEECDVIFDPDALTLGFARRFTTYKRPALLLNNPERLTRILTNNERPVQLVLAGKAHPQDEEGAELIKLWNDFAKRPALRSRLIFLRDYNMRQAEWLTRGVDVWINTPRRPWEACGTSGMKILANGGLNLSQLDGWWQEAYTPDVGWAIGDGREHGDDSATDAAEADALYQLLEEQIVPEFYERDEAGLPRRWITRVRESMATLAPRFSANRTVREYVGDFYIPAVEAYAERVKTANDPSIGIAAWEREWSRQRPSLHFGRTYVEATADSQSFSIEVYLGELSPDMVRVELYADGAQGAAPTIVMATCQTTEAVTSGYRRYVATVPPTRAASAFTPRIIPHHPLARIPLELPDIIWQR